MLRFNTDIGRLEVWRNDHWATILGEQSATLGGRGIFFGGEQPGIYYNTMEYVTISTTGNAQDFGDYQEPKRVGHPVHQLLEEFLVVEETHRKIL